jgi:CMP-N-acetylneuraminic acid synthetase
LKIFALIPARAGSKGIKDKNLQKIGRDSLIQIAVRQSIYAKKLSGVIVSSDSNEIIREAMSISEGWHNLSAFKLDKFTPLPNDTKLYHIREKALGTDDSLIGATIAEVARHLKRIGLSDFGILLLQPTSPFRSSDEIDNFIVDHSTKENVFPAMSVTRVTDAHPARMYKEVEGVLEHLDIYAEMEFAPRQQLPPLYLRDGAFYLMSEDMALKGIPVNRNSRFTIRTFPRTLNIDNQYDLEFARALFEKQEK